MADRVDSIVSFPVPKTKKQLQSFLGMINLYHSFLPKIASVLVPLNKVVVSCGSSRLIPDGTWSSECNEAFSLAKNALASATLLHHPSGQAETRITVDASETALGASLEQRHGHS